MQDILTCAMGLDVYRDIIVACLAKGELGSDPEIEIRSFSTLIPEMKKLRDWVLDADCRHVAMESTGIYWQPIYEMLEPCFDGEINILVVNARHMKNVPGRKTDMRDAQWIATLLRAGLLKGSFIPDKEFRELRHLTRYRKSIVHDITAQKNRIDKFLQSSGFRFAAFLSDAFGASGRNIIRNLIQNGSIDRAALDKCLKTQTRKRIDQILIALNGNLSIHQRSFLAMTFGHLESLEAHRKAVEDAITGEILKHSEALDLLCSIPGIDVTAAAAIIAEIGTDMSSFSDPQHICSWAGLSPGNNESAGKRKSAHINKGKRTWERRWNSWQSDAPCRKPFQLPAVPNNRKPRGLPFSPVGSVGASNRLWRLEVATGDPHHCAAVDSPVRYSCRVKPAEPFCRTRYGF